MNPLRDGLGRQGLGRRLLLALTAVVVLSAGLTLVLTGPLLRSSTESAVREGLARQADLLARLPVAALATGRGQQVARSGDLSLGVVTRAGGASGVAASLSPEELAALLAGQPVSTTVHTDEGRLLVEARPARAGGAVALATSDDTVQRSLAQQRRRILLALAIGLAAAVVVAAGVAAWLARPLAATADAARRLAAGERGVPLPEAGTREIADVTAALGHLDEALRTSEGRQRRFLLSVSHELRTPLTTLRGYADALADGDVDADELVEVGETMRAEAQRLERYVADLLALARVEADDFSLEVGPIDLAEVVASTAAAWTARGASRGVAVDAEVSGPVVAETDGHRVRQVLDALVDNAVRVCAEGGRVVVAVRPDPGPAAAGRAGCLLEVRDSGPGLTPDDVSVAFEPGVLHERHADRAGGAGLGLALVDRLVTRLGGRVSVSPSPEGGATFAVHLP